MPIEHHLHRRRRTRLPHARRESRPRSHRNRPIHPELPINKDQSSPIRAARRWPSAELLRHGTRPRESKGGTGAISPRDCGPRRFLATRLEGDRLQQALPVSLGPRRGLAGHGGPVLRLRRRRHLPARKFIPVFLASSRLWLARSSSSSTAAALPVGSARRRVRSRCSGDPAAAGSASRPPAR
jgi:hypothetical protein